MPKNRGIIELIILLVIAVVILSYLKVDLKGIIESQTFQENLLYLKSLWLKYVLPQISMAWHYLWTQIVQPLWAVLHR